MGLTDKELRSRHGLSRTQFEALERSVNATVRFGEQWKNEPIPRLRHTANGLGFGVVSSTIRVLSTNGYVTLELVHTPDEIASLRSRQTAAIENAKALLDEGDWKNALAALTTASKLDAATETRRWKLTDKALQVVVQAG